MAIVLATGSPAASPRPRREGLVEFSWDGQVETDTASGRGWVVLDGDALAGGIYIHLGDNSAFTAVRGGTRPGGRPRRGKG